MGFEAEESRVRFRLVVRVELRNGYSTGLFFWGEGFEGERARKVGGVRSGTGCVVRVYELSPVCVSGQGGRESLGDCG